MKSRVAKQKKIRKPSYNQLMEAWNIIYLDFTLSSQAALFADDYPGRRWQLRGQVELVALDDPAGCRLSYEQPGYILESAHKRLQ